MKKVAILGITGSIGSSSIKVIRNHPEKFSVIFASSHTNYQKLFFVALALGIKKVVLTGLNVPLLDTPKNIKVYYGQESLMKLIQQEDFEILLNAISGSAGLGPSITAIQKGCILALANKETFVMAGDLIEKLLKTPKSRVIPVDSEHSAIFQCIGDSKKDDIEELFITASGGPFVDLPLEKFKKITVKDALAHPTWSMGKKITIDSATMLNKAFEVIEAHHLFEIPYSRITPVIHRQSIVHSMVKFVDGSIISQMSTPSMELPILYAFGYPNRLASDSVETNLFELAPLTFEKIDKERYPLFFVGVEAGIDGGLAPTVLNAASEAATKLFLEGKIGFEDIHRIIISQLQSFDNIVNPTLEEIVNCNKENYNKTLMQNS